MLFLALFLFLNRYWRMCGAPNPRRGLSGKSLVVGSIRSTERAGAPFLLVVSTYDSGFSGQFKDDLGGNLELC